MGSKVDKYVNTTGNDAITEKLLFIIDLADNNTITSGATNSVNLVRILNSNKEEASPDVLSYTVLDNRTFELTIDSEKDLTQNVLDLEDKKVIHLDKEIMQGATLSIKYKDKNIADVLDMRVSEALEFFENVPKIKHKLQTMVDVGLGYVKLGQSAPTLSGGEAGRVKLAKELQKKATGKSLFILDEPTTGLHTDDIKRLLVILERIVENGDTVIVIEHNLDVIKVADYIIDLGPDGGSGGGNIVATGTPEEVSKVKESYTGEFLKKIL